MGFTWTRAGRGQPGNFVFVFFAPREEPFAAHLAATVGHIVVAVMVV